MSTKSSLGTKMSRLAGHERGQGNIIFPCSTDHEQDWQIYPVDPLSCYLCDRTYIHIFAADYHGIWFIVLMLARVECSQSY